MSASISIQWLGHSCFRIDNGVNAVVLDPYNESVGYPPLHVTASNVLTSHAHGDHSHVEAVDLEPADPRPEFSFSVRTVATFHDDEGGRQRGSNRVHLLDTCGIRLVHLGDLGHGLSAEQADGIGRPDVLMIPVGGHYTIDAEQAAEAVRQLDPVKVIPMHYRHRYGPAVLTTVEPFLELLKDTYDIRRMPGSTVTYERPKARELWVLSYEDPS